MPLCHFPFLIVEPRALPLDPAGIDAALDSWRLLIVQIMKLLKLNICRDSIRARVVFRKFFVFTTPSKECTRGKFAFLAAFAQRFAPNVLRFKQFADHLRFEEIDCHGEIVRYATLRILPGSHWLNVGIAGRRGSMIATHSGTLSRKSCRRTMSTQSIAGLRLELGMTATIVVIIAQCKACLSTARSPGGLSVA